MTLQNVRLPTIALAVNTPAKPSGPAVPQQPPPQINPLAPAGPQAMQFSAGPQSMPGSPMAADVDPTTVSYYSVMVGDVFEYNKVKFMPGKIYHVAPAMYLGSLDDGSKFSDHCTQIIPQPKSEGAG